MSGLLLNQVSRVVAQIRYELEIQDRKALQIKLSLHQIHSPIAFIVQKQM